MTKLTEEQFNIFILGFLAGRNSSKHKIKKDIEFWHKVFVEIGLDEYIKQK